MLNAATEEAYSLYPSEINDDKNNDGNDNSSYSPTDGKSLGILPVKDTSLSVNTLIDRDTLSRRSIATTTDDTSTNSNDNASSFRFSFSSPSSVKKQNAIAVDRVNNNSSSGKKGSLISSSALLPATSSSAYSRINKLCTSLPLQTPLIPIVHILVLDEVDGLGIEIKNTEVQAALKLALFRWMDNCQMNQNQRREQVSGIAVIATTNKPGEVDVRFRRGGRLEVELDILATSPSDRIALLRKYIQSSWISTLKKLLQWHNNTIFDKKLDIESNPYNSKALRLDESLLNQMADRVANEIALQTGGYVAADLNMLTSEAIELFGKQFNEIEYQSHLWESVLLKCFHNILSQSEPSCLRGIKMQIDMQVSYYYMFGMCIYHCIPW